MKLKQVFLTKTGVLRKSPLIFQDFHLSYPVIKIARVVFRVCGGYRGEKRVRFASDCHVSSLICRYFKTNETERFVRYSIGGVELTLGGWQPRIMPNQGGGVLFETFPLPFLISEEAKICANNPQKYRTERRHLLNLMSPMLLLLLLCCCCC